jgi:hypothetical protein
MLASSERAICCSCGGFFPRGDTYKISGQDERLQGMRLDRCGYHENFGHCCRLCHIAISQWRVPKILCIEFRQRYYVPGISRRVGRSYASRRMSYCVSYCEMPSCWIGTILKLRPGGHVSPTNYSAVRGHMIVIPQEPGPLLQILPSPGAEARDPNQGFLA